MGREPQKEQQTVSRLIEEMRIFWTAQEGFEVVERERLDLVLKELKLKTLKLDEYKIQFILNEVLGVKGILFIRMFNQSKLSPLKFFNRQKIVYARFVDADTTLFKAYEKIFFKEGENLEKVCQKLGEKLKLSLVKRYKL